MSQLVFDTVKLNDELALTALAPWAAELGDAVINQGHALKHGHLPRWEAAVDSLPKVAESSLSIQRGVVTLNGNFAPEDETKLKDSLEGLIPWRKGPFQFGPVSIDTEWRSDWKWDRLEPHISPLHGKLVLDVGCGSGYHLWRMRQAGAKQVLGVDPSLHFLKQFEATQLYAQDAAVQFLPLPMEALPPNMGVFDTAFSMGVLYHRRQPLDHLKELQASLSVGGELILETLIIPGDDSESLELNSRYANMRNIYELPTRLRLEEWVLASGFCDIRTVSVCETSLDEQRSTHWMPNHSLVNALDPSDQHLTIEGHTRPLRAIVIARWNG
ncbi:MAG: tRNA 5-methoxyuridine(34)/uridine 5-oxyacetic acid(34) synthase CmoB [Granulosicoccus sp.]